MSIRERLFTQSVERGDRLVYTARLPEIPGYTTGTQDVRDTDAYRVIFTDSSNGTEQSFDGTFDAYRDENGTEILLYEFEIETDAWPARPYYFRIEGTWRRDGVSRSLTFIRGIVQVLDTNIEGSDALAHSQTMILALREVISQKLSGTSDIASYSIGGRDISLVTVGELRRELRRYENDLVRLRGGEKFGPKVGSANTAPEG